MMTGRQRDLILKLGTWQLELAAWVANVGSLTDPPADGSLELSSWRPDDSRGSRETARHGERLSVYATLLAARVGVDEDVLATVRLGALLHDVGKHALPEDLLLKSGPLSREEYDLVKQHTTIGDALCAAVSTLDAVRPIVRHHHERLDGTGYPDGLRGDAVPLLAQVVGIVDVYDALTNVRAYKPALDMGTACAILSGEAKKGWRQRDLVWAFIDIVEAQSSRG